MIKKKILLIVIFSSSFLGIFGCLNCGEHFSFQEINNVTASLLSNDIEKIGDKTDLESLIVNIDIDVNFIANHFSLPLINQSYAWSCDENGELGVKDRIVDLKFYSTAEYLGFPARTELDFKNSLELNKTELIEFLNGYLFGFAIFIEQKQIGHFDLFVSFEFESGEIQEFELVSFEWE